jgi:hypothetical protein
MPQTETGFWQAYPPGIYPEPGQMVSVFFIVADERELERYL